MYIDAYLDRKRNVVCVAEKQNTGIVLKEYPANYTFYFESAAGTHHSIFGNTCRKFSTNDNRKFLRKLEELKDKKIFEHDINPIFRCLADHYRDAPLPKLNVTFYDIEVDFDLERGFAPPDNPFNRITSITLYHKWLDQLITLALLPPTLTYEQGEEITNQFTNCHLFDDETELLETFLDLIENSDILTGWNCVAKTENVWLIDRIKKMGDLTTNDTTVQHGKILRYHDSGKKKANRIHILDGSSIVMSDDHIVPVMWKQREKYKYPHTLIETRVDKKVSEIKQMLDDGLDVYVESSLHSNTNANYTYRQLIVENLDVFFADHNFDIVVDNSLIPLIKQELKKKGTYKQLFPNGLYIGNSCSKKLRSKNFDFITRDHLLSMIRSSPMIKISNNGKTSSIILDEPISNDICQLMGFVFTDGSFWIKENIYTLYNTNIPSLEFYQKVLHKEHPKSDNNLRSLKKTKDVKSHDKFPHLKEKGNEEKIYTGYSRIRFSNSKKMALLSRLIYNEKWKKNINLEILSRLSLEQFNAFFAGLHDGDGYVSGNVISLCNFDNCIGTIAELLRWNGVFARFGSRNKTNLDIHYNQINKKFIDNLNLTNSKRLEKKKLLQLYPTTNSPSKLLDKFVFENKVILRISTIEELNDSVDMADIETEQHYFNCNGIIVHNCSTFDLPYLVNRVRMILGDRATTRFCLWNQRPRKKIINRFGKDTEVYDLVGKISFDLLEAYRKHVPQQMHSYKLDFIAKHETGHGKVPYEGSLDDLYKKDFYKFIDYNRVDVTLLNEIDEKKKFIDLSNALAHSNCILFKNTLGSVVMIEQAVWLSLRDKDLVMPSRKADEEEVESDIGDEDEENTKAVGAFVSQPRTPMVKFVGCTDYTSLYPSVLRALGASPENIVGQCRDDETKALIAENMAKLPAAKRAEAWDGVFCTVEMQHILDKDDKPVTIDFENGDAETRSGKEWWEYFLEKDIVISANGTLFSKHTDGIVPSILTKWFAERKQLQAYEKQFKLLNNGGIDIPQNIVEALQR